MYWKNMSDFLQMGGYGLYVWVSFGITFACMATELFLLRARRLSNEKIKDLL
jgi:heme exporter protein D